MTPRIYLIGTGVIARHHAAASQAAFSQPAELFACDPDAGARERFLADYPMARVFESSDLMLAESPARADDIVVVATPPRFHCAEAIKAFRSGRHVVCEKPLTMRPGEAREMLAAAREAGRHLGCCSNRFLGWELNVRVGELLDAGEIGRPYLVDWLHREVCNRSGLEYQPGSWFFLDKSRNGGGTVMDWGPYDFAVLLSVLRPVQATVLHALCEQADIPTGLPEGVINDVETQGVATIEFRRADGTPVIVRYERTSASHGPAVSIQGIYGTTGYLEWDWLPFGENLTLRRSRTQPGTPPAPETLRTITPPNHDGWMYAPVREMHRLIQGAGDARVLANEQAVNAALLLHAVYQSAEERRAVEVEFC